MLKVICVLKTGGDYNERYVENLNRAVFSKMRQSFEFICLSDLKKYTELTDHLPGWWSKIEIFKIVGPAIYFDLDTIIIDDISVFVETVLNDEIKSLYMLKAFRSGEAWASGIMAWTGDWSWLYREFCFNRDMPAYQWDQRYINFKLKQRQIIPKTIQNYMPHIYSYKHHCKNGLPEDAQIICFHGHPRPHEIKDDWIKEHWI